MTRYISKSGLTRVELLGSVRHAGAFTCPPLPLVAYRVGDSVAVHVMPSADFEEFFAPEPVHPRPATGVERIAAERERQQRQEGFRPDGDLRYQRGQLVRAAVSYLLSVLGESAQAAGRWPWFPGWFKPTTPERDLEKAGALIAAELDRRAAS